MPTLAFDTYQETVRKRCIENGMHHVFVYQDPCTNTGVDLFKSAGKVNLETIKAYIVTYMTKADTFTLQNLDWSGQYLLSSISATLHGQVLKKIL